MGNGSWRTLGSNPYHPAGDDGKWSDIGGERGGWVVKPVPPKDKRKAQLNAVELDDRRGFTRKQSKDLLDMLGIGERIDNDDLEGD